MRLHIQVLHGGESRIELLRRDGWQMEAESVGCMSAFHPDVKDERSARRRLHVMGMLTSAALRIEFPLVRFRSAKHSVRLAEQDVTFN